MTVCCSLSCSNRCSRVSLGCLGIAAIAEIAGVAEVAEHYGLLGRDVAVNALAPGQSLHRFPNLKNHDIKLVPESYYVHALPELGMYLPQPDNL